MNLQRFCGPAIALLFALPAWAESPQGPPTAEPLAQATAIPVTDSLESVPVARAVTYQEALAFAQTHQPEIREALARVATRQAQTKVPRSQWLPFVGATAQVIDGSVNNTSASYYGSPEVGIVRIGGTTAVGSPAEREWNGFASTFVAAGISQEIFDFGRIAAQSAAQDALLRMERGQADVRRLDVKFGVEEAFFAVLAAKGVLTASQEAYQRTLKHRDFAGAGVKAGLREPIELTRAEADLDRSETQLVRARGGVEEAQAVLAAAAGSPELKLDAAGPPPPAPELPVLSKALDDAAQRDPRLAAAVADWKAQQQATRALRNNLLPDLHLLAALSGRAGGAPESGGGLSDSRGWTPDIPNWNIGVVLSVPLFDGPTLALERASRRAEAEKAAATDVVKLKEVELIQQTFVSTQVAEAALPGLQKSVDAAHANYAQADARFTSGLGNAVELADAEALRTEAEIQLALGQFELARSRAAFARATAESL